MKKIKQIESGHLYLFQGKASANSLFIEDLEEARQFMIRANFYFKGYLKIHEYLLTKDGWNMIVRIKDRKSILGKSKIEGDNESMTGDLVWKIISERVRIFLSTFVKFANKKQGRTGGKVHSSYERFSFDSLAEAKNYIKKLRKGMIKLCQNRKKYRGRKKHYQIPKKLGKGSVFMSSRKLKKRLKNCSEKLECLEILKLKQLVLLKSDQSPEINQNSNKSPFT